LSKTQNTSLRKSKMGCRLPHESHDVGDGYTAPSPVKKYRLSPEELAKYGPIKKVEHRRQLLTRDVLVEKLKTLTVGQVAQRHNIPAVMVFKLVEKYGLELDKKNRLKEGESMENVDKSLRKNEFEPYEPKKTRLEIAREKIDLEKYKNLKAQGKTDKDMYEELDIPVDVFYTLKKEWGIAQTIAKSKPDPKNDKAAGKKMTISKAMELREELCADRSCIADIMDPGKLEISPKVRELLSNHYEKCGERLERIDKVFDSTEIEV
jgi:hypothetical protein